MLSIEDTFYKPALLPWFCMCHTYYKFIFQGLQWNQLRTGLIAHNPPQLCSQKFHKPPWFPSHSLWLPTAYEVWRKVLFSQACATHSVQRGGVGVSRGYPEVGWCVERGLSHFSQGEVSHYSQDGRVGCPIFQKGSPIFQKMEEPPPPLPDTRIQSIRGLHASYWNAFFFYSRSGTHARQFIFQGLESFIFYLQISLNIRRNDLTKKAHISSIKHQKQI